MSNPAKGLSRVHNNGRYFEPKRLGWLFLSQPFAGNDAWQTTTNRINDRILQAIPNRGTIG